MSFRVPTNKTVKTLLLLQRTIIISYRIAEALVRGVVDGPEGLVVVLVDAVVRVPGQSEVHEELPIDALRENQ